jgi:tetratricopeptide (TPR) repeat protein
LERAFMPTLNIFISSKMQELQPERQAIAAAIAALDYGDLTLRAWVFENDAYASGKSIQSIYLKELQQSALYIGLFWNEYGEYTIDEFNHARDWGIEQHLYVKDVQADKRDPRLSDFLQAQGAVTDGITAKWFTSTEQLTEAVKVAIAHWIDERLRGRSSVAEAVVVDHADDVPRLPTRFFGREAQLATIAAALVHSEPALLHGLGGEGKSALAAQAAHAWLKAHGGKLLWLSAGAADAEGMFQAIARPFGAVQAIASQTGEAQKTAVRQLLRQAGITLLVADDCWDGEALLALRAALPRDLPLLVTSRQRYPLDGAAVAVEALPQADALALLAYHAGEGNPAAPPDSPSPLTERVLEAEVLLVERLARLAFAIEIAGRNLRANGWSVAELNRRLDAGQTSATDMEAPLGYRERGRESVARLLDVSLAALPAAARAVFLAFGAFFAPQSTPELLARYLRLTASIAAFVPLAQRALGLTSPLNPLSEGRGDFAVRSPSSPSPLERGWGEVTTRGEVAEEGVGGEGVDSHLDTLALHGLLTLLPATPDSAPAARLHDVAYAYARAQTPAAARQRGLDICLTFVKQFTQPSLPAFAALRPALPTLLGAAEYAYEVGRYADCEVFAWQLYSADGSQFLIYQGFSREAIQLLQSAASAAEKRGDARAQGAHLGNLGIAYGALGQVERAIEQYDKIVEVFRANGDRQSEGAALGNLGNAYRNLGQFERAIDYLQQALVIHRAIGDRRGEGNALGNLGTAYRNLGQVEHAIDYYQQALLISRAIGDRMGEGNRLGNLGIAYADLGQVERAIDFYQQTLVIHRAIGDRMGEGNDLGNLGIAYRNLGQVERAIDYQQQALIISREIGDRMGEGSVLNNLGAAYEGLGDLPRALDFLRQARAIFAEIGAAHLVAQTERNIARVEAALRGGG